MTSHSLCTFGIDEAGRGPILGPMVLAAVAVTPAGAAALATLGVRDSKSFGASTRGKDTRARLAALICERDRAWERRHLGLDEADIRAAYYIAPPDEIDAAVLGGNGGLNRLEREIADNLLISLQAPSSAEIIADGASLFSPLRAAWPNLRAVDKGESEHIAVAAASVVAKHYRDEAMSAIEQKYAAGFGVIRGGGYPNASTRKFLDAYIARHGELPPEARKSWGAAR